jgi:inorganic pyrophosphatase
MDVKHPETFDEKGLLNVVVETPKGSRNKLGWDEKYEMYTMKGVLPAGMAFPFDFGFLPGTKGQDGDPLDILVLMDAPTYPGTLVPARLIGAIEAEQKEEGKTERNDRLVAVADVSRNHKGIDQIDQLSPNLLHEIEHFFTSYNVAKGKEFRILGRVGPERARKLIDEALGS